MTIHRDAQGQTWLLMHDGGGHPEASLLDEPSLDDIFHITEFWKGPRSSAPGSSSADEVDLGLREGYDDQEYAEASSSPSDDTAERSPNDFPPLNLQPEQQPQG